METSQNGFQQVNVDKRKPGAQETKEECEYVIVVGLEVTEIAGENSGRNLQTRMRIEMVFYQKTM